MSIRALATLTTWVLLAAATSGQYQQAIGVTGVTTTGTQFTMRIEAGATYIRDLDFSITGKNLSAVAMAEEFVARINEDYRSNGSTGFQADNPTRADGRKDFDATFELHCTVPITAIRVGALGNPTTPIPRPPGVAFNPNILNYQAPQGPNGFVASEPGGANSQMRVDGLNPAASALRKIESIIGTPFELKILSGSNPNQGFSLFTGPIFLSLLQTPFGALDIGIPAPTLGQLPGGLTVLGDGIFNGTGTIWDQVFTTDPSGTFTLSLANTGGFGPFQIAIQGMVQDPTLPPFNLHLTQAADIRFDQGQHSNLPVPSDGFLPVAMTVGAMPFYGASHGVVFVHENGFLSFSTPATVTGTSIDPQAALASAPAVFANLSNWSVAGSPGVELYEFGREIRFTWGGNGTPIHHALDNDMARFEIVMIKQRGPVPDADAGAVMIDVSQLDPTANGGNDNFMGISPGNNLDGTPFSRDLGLRQVGSGPLSSLLQLSNRNATAATQLQPPSGGFQVYSNGSGQTNRRFCFFPPSAASGSGNRPHSVASRQNPDDFLAVAPPSQLSVSAGANQNLLLLGYFQFFVTSAGPQGQVILDPTGAAGVGPIPMVLTSIMDGTGFLNTISPGLTSPVQINFRDFEGALFHLSQALPAATPTGIAVDLRVVFPSGAVFDRPSAVLIVP